MSARVSTRSGSRLIARHCTITSADQRRFTRLASDVASCTACTGVAHCHVLTAANGPLDADVLFVAEAVGRRGGAVTGVPLTRDISGQRFNAFLDLAGIDRSRVFVSNAVLCNPLDVSGRNRPPTRAEVVRCRPFLARTLTSVRATVVVALGRVALEALRDVHPHELVMPRDVARPAQWARRTLVPMYHPSRQSTLHRPHQAQERDWLALGSLLRTHDLRRQRFGLATINRP